MTDSHNLIRRISASPDNWYNLNLNSILCLLPFGMEIPGQLRAKSKICMCVCVCMSTKLFHLCPTLCNPMDYSLPSSSVHGIFQARILEWIAMPSSRRSSQSRDRILMSTALAAWFFTTSTSWEAQSLYIWSIQSEHVRRARKERKVETYWDSVLQIILIFS